MSINEMDSKIKELRELRRMADELAAEMETIQDSIKAHMDAEGVDTINGTDWKVTYKAVTSSRLDANALKRLFPIWHSSSPRPPQPAGSVSHDEDHHSHRRSCAAHPLHYGSHRSIRKALCATADQSKAQRAVTTNQHKGGRYGHYTGLPPRMQGGFLYGSEL